MVTELEKEKPLRASSENRTSCSCWLYQLVSLLLLPCGFRSISGFRPAANYQMHRLRKLLLLEAHTAYLATQEQAWGRSWLPHTFWWCCSPTHTHTQFLPNIFNNIAQSASPKTSTSPDEEAKVHPPWLTAGSISSKAYGSWGHCSAK